MRIDNCGILSLRALHGRTITRRGVLLGAAGAASAALLPMTARAQTVKTGGRLIVGCAGGGAKDKLDAHSPVSNPDAFSRSTSRSPSAMPITNSR